MDPKELIQNLDELPAGTRVVFMVEYGGETHYVIPDFGSGGTEREGDLLMVDTYEVLHEEA